jgi:excisionase family DNA binding protein
MDEYVALPSMPDYVSIKEAADMLGLSPNRVYEYVTEGRLSGVRAADVIMIPLEEVKQFQRGITGRPRKNNPKWRISPGPSMLSMTLISVHIQAGRQEAFLQKLEEIRKSGKHIFPGTIARFIMGSETNPGQAVIVLAWRGAAMPSESEREEALEAFRQELSDVLDWNTAQYNTGKVFMHT